LRQSRIVLCNPPFEDFDEDSRKRCKPKSVRKPVELLTRVLSNLHPDGMIGFVLPRLVIDGAGYKSIRADLANRFANVDVIALPDKAFETSDQETAIVLAYKPRKGGRPEAVAVHYAQVDEADWNKFKTFYTTSRSDTEQKSVEDATARLTVQELRHIWSYTSSLDTLGDIAAITRGLEWNINLTTKQGETGNREKLVHRKKECAEDRRGLPPRAKPFFSYQCPPTAFLRMKPKDERANSYNKEWNRPKVILNKATKSRSHWRIAAFSDDSGLVFYQTFTGVWPHDPSLAVALSAVLNGPVANAFVSTIEGKIDITSDTLKRIPVPAFLPEDIAQISTLVANYRQILDGDELQLDYAKADVLLRQIDAIVLKAYDLPPRLERNLLDFFNGCRRQVPFDFHDYFPPEFESYFSLHDYISREFQQSTAKAVRDRFCIPSKHILQSLQAAADAFEIDQ